MTPWVCPTSSDRFNPAVQLDEGEEHKTTEAGIGSTITVVGLLLLQAERKSNANRMQARDLPDWNLLMNPSTARLRGSVWKTLSVEAGLFFGNLCWRPRTSVAT